MPDILPDDAALMRWVEDRAKEVFDLFGYQEIRTPLLETTEVFTRSIGEDTDIVEKEMYSFDDRGGKNISLRPEATASIIRAYIEHNLHVEKDITKLYYIGPMFRGERPQKGRQRQFYQIGAEIIGSSDPYLDAELILNLRDFLENINIAGFEILINSLGCKSDRVAYKKAFGKYLAEKKNLLCEDCVRRTKTNVLRVLDCKNKECRKVVEKAPTVLEYLCGKCDKEYRSVKSLLSGMGVDYTEKKDLVRGLDYYTNTVFEIVHPLLGAQDAIAAGGRYDDLSKEMGGPEVGATGYAVGVERLLIAIDKDAVQFASPGVLVISVDKDSRHDAFALAEKFRKGGISCQMDLSGRSLKAQLRRANKDGRVYVVMVGEDERKKGKLLVKNMETGEQESLDFEEACKKLKHGT
jgi:histidyl-tRNA synthetase